MKRILACIALALLLCGCIESNLALVPDDAAVFVGGLEGQWVLEDEPAKILCAQAMEGTSLYALTVPDDDEVVVLAFLPLIEHHYLLRWDEERAPGEMETLYVIVRQDLDGLFGLMIAENKDAVLEVARDLGFPAGSLEFTDYSLTINHPDREAQIALLQAVAARSEDFPGLKYVKVGELPCPEPAPEAAPAQ